MDPSSPISAPMTPVNIDLHIHIAARDEPGCILSEKMRRQVAWKYMLRATGVSPDELERDFDGMIRRHILGVIHDAPSIAKGVLLAMDGRYSRPGDTPDPDTDLLVTNDYICKLANPQENAKILFGASINPNRGQASGLRELERCLQMTPPPVLMKWVPNTQEIDPSLKDHEWFYKALAAARLPLLCHTGPEYAIPVRRGRQNLGDPGLLERALDQGVLVIACHAASRFWPLERYDYVEKLAVLMQQYPNLYADLAAMCVTCRALKTVRRVRDLIPPERMLLGSDYPVPVNTMPAHLMRDPQHETHHQMHQITNPLEKNYQQLLAMGFPPAIGTQAAELLGQM